MREKINPRISWSVKRLFALFVMGSITLTSTISVAALSRKVCIRDGEQEITVITINKDTEQILEQVGIQLEENDEVVRDDNNKDAINITVKRAFDVTVNVDGQSHNQVFTEGTVADAIAANKIPLGQDDIVTPGLDTELTPDMQINVTRQYNVRLTVGGEETKQVLVPEGSVQKALGHLEISLGNDDIINVDLEAPVKENMSIRIDRVEYNERNESDEIPYDTITTLSDTLNEGETDFQDGENGERVTTIREKIVNGKIVESKQVKYEMTKKPTNAYKIIGIKPVKKAVEAIQPVVPKSSGSGKFTSVSSGYIKDNNSNTFIDHNGNEVNYKSVLTGSATAYTASVGAITSTGKVAKYGNVAVNPNVIPYGSKLYICTTDGSNITYGYAVAADTGGALMSGSALVDLYYDSEAECISFGRRTVSVYILS